MSFCLAAVLWRPDFPREGVLWRAWTAGRRNAEPRRVVGSGFVCIDHREGAATRERRAKLPARGRKGLHPRMSHTGQGRPERSLLREGLILLSGSLDGLISGASDVAAAATRSSTVREIELEPLSAITLSTCPGCSTIVSSLGADAVCFSPLVDCFILHLLGLYGNKPCCDDGWGKSGHRSSKISRLTPDHQLVYFRTGTDGSP